MFDAVGRFLVDILQETFQGLNSFIIYKIALNILAKFSLFKILKFFEIKVIKNNWNVSTQLYTFFENDGHHCTSARGTVILLIEIQILTIFGDFDNIAYFQMFKNV